MPETEKGFFSPGGAGLFSFFGNEPTSYEALLHRRKIAEALAAQKKGMPKNLGEGLTYLGESIGEAGLNYRLHQAELAQDKREAGYETPRGGTSHVPGGGAYTPPNNSPPSGATAPRAAVDTGATVAVTDEDPAIGTTTVAYAPQAPRDPEPTAAAPSVVAPPASAPAPFFPAPRPSHPSSMIRNPVQPTGGGELPPPATPPSHGVLAGGPVRAPEEGGVTGDTAALESGLQRLAAQRRDEIQGSPLFNPQPTMPSGYSGVGSTPRVANTGAFERPTAVADAGYNEMDAAAPNLVADAPLPRARPGGDGGTTVADGGFNALDQAAVNRANPMVRGVNPRLVEAVNAGALALPEGHTVRISSGHREGDSGYHGKHSAIDVKIVRPDGTEIPSRGKDTTGLYTQLARGAYTHALKNDQQITWGGAFDTAKRGGTGNRDLMHFDTGPERGNLDPSLRLSRLGPLPDNFDPNAGRGPTQVASTPREAVTNSMATLAALPTQADAPALARERDVLGGGGMGGAQPRTASLGRAGVQSDAVPLGMNPTGSGVDAGVAEAVQQRNAITDKILQNQNKIPVQEEPSPDPTQAGASMPPTISSSTAASSTTASPSLNPQVAQARGATTTDAPAPGTAPGSVFGAGLERARAAAQDAGKPTAIPAAPPGATIPSAPPPDSAAYVKPPPFKSAIEPPGPEPTRTVLGPSDAQKYWGPIITDRTVSPSLQAKAKRIYDEEEKFRALNQQHLDNDYLNKRTKWDKDVEAWKNKDEHDVKTLTGRMALEKAQFDAQYMAPFEAREKAATAALKEAELGRDPITLAKAQADLRNANLQTQQERYKLRIMNPLERKKLELANLEAQQKVDAGQHTVFEGRILKHNGEEWKDVSPILNPDSIQLNEGQTKGLRYYMNGIMAKSQMTKIDQLTSLKGQTAANVKFIGNFLTSDEYKSMQGAQNSWLINIVRSDTGAVIGPDEIETYRKIHFPVPGDGPRQIQEKQDRRDAAEHAIYEGLGTAKSIGARYRKEIEAMDATGIPDGKVRTDTKTGEQQESSGGKWRPRKATP